MNTLTRENNITTRTAAHYNDYEDDFENEWWETEMLKRPAPKPFSVEELRARIAESERQIAAGMVMDFDEAMDLIDQRLDKKAHQLQMAEAI